MKKCGIVLMMTLILITVMMGIVALILLQSEKLLRLGNIGFSQGSTLRIVKDLETQLPSLLSAIKGAEELDLAMRLPIELQTHKGDFILKATLASPYSRLNINRLMSSDGNISEPHAAFMMRIFETYPIADPQMLMKLVLDSTDVDRVERARESEISNASPDFKNGLIANEKQFNLILARYIKITGDTAVLSIPWHRYIGYEGEKMDLNAVNTETLALILPTTSREQIRAMTLYRTKAFSTKEEAIAALSALAPVFDTYFFIYQPNTPYHLLCDVRMRENSREEHLRFHYNLLDKRVQRVELL